MAQHATRTSFKKGQIANPNGRPPKGYSITETVKSMLSERPEVKKALTAKILELALKGDVTAIKMLWNYMDGMPVQSTEISGKEGSGIKLNLINEGTYIPPVRNAIAPPESGDTKPGTV